MSAQPPKQNGSISAVKAWAAQCRASLAAAEKRLSTQEAEAWEVQNRASLEAAEQHLKALNDAAQQVLPDKAPRVRIELHNPDRMKQKDVGKGYRLLTVEEFKKHRDNWRTELPDIEFSRSGSIPFAWVKRAPLFSTYMPLNAKTTYRIPKK